MKKISVVGLGYIGLPTAILAAQSGYDVFGFDVDIKKVSKIKNADPGIVEPEIDQRLADVIASKKLNVGSELESAECFVVAVPTPFKEGKKADLSYVFSACEFIAKVLQPGNLVLLESTIPVYTTRKAAAFLEEQTGLIPGKDFFVAHCPERVLPGKIFYELVTNDRVVGGINEQSSKLALEFYSRFVKGEIFLTDDKTAELVKLVENSSRDSQIAFANQVAGMAREAGVEPLEVIKLANKHPRVDILNPGCGVGGHCIAVDPWFLVESFPKSTQLLKAAREVNDARPLEVVNEVLSKVDKDKKSNVLVLGVTFKANVDDMRESPALKIALELNKHSEDLNLLVCEPNVTSEELSLKGLTSTKIADGFDIADVVVILVLHDQFKNLTKQQLENKKIIDTCGLVFQLNQRLNDSYLNKNFIKSNVEQEKVL